ncbi:MAG: ATP-dependent zinc metalloprotease FtsH [Peptostreptococcus porci]|uniref:ATP-dependent zinc metalloprotease FtsH n=1 Tax=Peptostreptococcus porci TaxID=2652282 RepID=A0A6N7XIW4_9FIRM|nr:ATP-dependent zinc metalloprotease FtsH [Peptostreptococcus porci]MDY5480416.1 ATP-dependent zinc metalloprotease FtsH [Peptostreptococcus porci]MST63029.1 ATP-dependent zinc metalloprotease FtsH [Peptostreptococcus porci]
MDKDKRPKSDFLWFYSFLLVVMLIFNAFILPGISKKGVNEVEYSTFIQMLDKKEVKSVEVEDSKIVFTSNKKNDNKAYVTGNISDPDLVKKLENSGATYSKKIPVENSPLQNFVLTWVLPFLIFWLIGRMLVKNMGSKMGGSSMMSFGKSNAKLYVKSTGVTFDDVAGQDEAKEALTEIVDFLHSPDKYTSIGAKMPKGALLVGPPGTGKTLLAKAVAGEAGVPFFSISGSEFVEMFVGMGASRVRSLFKQANEKAPCIIFIDEIDAIGKRRDSNFGGNDEREQTLNQLLSEMDGFENDLGIVILAATNRPESLDKALLRPGRFDRRVPVELPDLLGRESILKVHSKNIKIDKNVDYNQIARATSGASGAELANIVNEAALRAVRNKRNIVLQEDLEESVETIIAGYQRKGAVINDEEKKIIAYHEVGHALVAAVGKHSAPVHKITIIPRTSGALGYTLQIDEQEKVLMTREEAIDKITTYTGGRAAEEVIFNIKTSGASNDIEMATKIARAMVTRFGMNDEIGMVALETVNNAYLGGDTSLVCSPETSSQIDKEVVKIVKSCHDRAVSILSDNIDKLHEISAYLLKHETITGEEFMDILNDEYKITTKAINKAEEQMVDDNSVTENSNEIFHVDSLELENDGSELEKTKNKMEDYDV